MMDQKWALLLARAQFAFMVSFHFLFPAFSIGLACYLAVLEGLWLKTGQVAYANLFGTASRFSPWSLPWASSRVRQT